MNKQYQAELTILLTREVPLDIARDIVIGVNKKITQIVLERAIARGLVDETPDIKKPVKKPPTFAEEIARFKSMK